MMVSQMTWMNPILPLSTISVPGVVKRVKKGKMHSIGPVITLLLLLSFTQSVIAQTAGGEGSGSTSTGRQKTNVTILEVLSPTTTQYDDAPTAYRHGFLAALWYNNYTVERVHVNVIQRSVTTNNITETIRQAVSEHPDLIAMVGPTSAPQLLTSRAILDESNLVAFAPLTDALSTRFWEKHFYFLMGDTNTAVYTLVRYALTYLRVKRLGFMYISGFSYGDEEYELAKKLASDTNNEITGLFRLDGTGPLNPDSAEFQAQWEQFANTRPQAVIIMGVIPAVTQVFIRRMLTDERTKDAYLMAPPRLQELVLDIWKSVVNAGTPFVSGQVFTTGFNPLATDTSYRCIQRFQRQMSKYLKESGQNQYEDHEIHLNDDTAGEMMVAGWMAGEVLLITLSDYDSTHNRDWFVNSLFAQRRYLIDDFVIGDFGGDIDPRAAAQGAIRQCNQGGNLLYLKKFVENYRAVNVPEGQYTTELTTCYQNYVLYDASFALIVLFTDTGGAGTYALQEVVRGQVAAVNTTNGNTRHPYVLKILSSTILGATNALIEEDQNFSLDIVLGVVFEAMLQVPDTVFIDPIFAVSRLNSFARNVILLSPTTEQQIFVLAEYLSTTSDPSAHAVARSSIGPSLFDVVRRSFETFGVTLSSTTQLGATDNVQNALAANGLTIVLDLAEPDVKVMAKHLEENKNARLFIRYAPFSVLYSDLQESFAGKEIAERMWITTNLPHWGNPNSRSTSVSQYHEAISNSTLWGPISLSNFVSSKAIQAAVEELTIINSTAIADYFYSRVVVTVNDMVYGPFADADSITCTGAAEDHSVSCAKNYGAASISVWPLSRAFNYNVPPLSNAITPSMIYRVPMRSGLTKQQLTGLIVGCVLGALLLIGLIVLLVYCCRDSRDNDNAPKELTDPVTLVFTDIESSTALWAACPEVMPDAVATHHRLIRSLIAKYKCYEVKTIGDSFMIASKSASNAVQLVLELQKSFLNYDWGTSAIDDAYHEFEEGKAAEDEEYVPPTARLDAAVYQKYWNGPRVRVGMHTGLSDIRHDEVTKGYDYYGGTSNMAARTESVANGGQVLLTRWAYMALSTAEREQLDVISLGPVPLRGVPKPVEMFQLNAVPGRSFAPLRLDREVDYMMDDDSTVDGSTDYSRGETLSATAGPLATVLTTVFSPFPLSQRLKNLQPVLQRWGVRVPAKTENMSQEEHCRDVVYRLAAKVNRVMERKGQVMGGGAQELGGTYHGTLGGTWDVKRASTKSGSIVRAVGQNEPHNLPEIRRSLKHDSVILDVNDVSRSSSNSSIIITASRPPNLRGVEWV